MRCGIIGRTNKQYTNMRDASAYRSVEKDENIENEKRVLHAEIVKPFFSSNDFNDRKYLWQEVEKCEKRKDAQLAREILIALPRELELQEQKKIVKEFCNKNLVSKGMICDYSIHNEKNQNGNYHAHILCTLRKIEKNSFGKKERNWNDRRLVKEWQKSWEKIANKSLMKKLELDEPVIEHKKKRDKSYHLPLKQYHLFKSASKEIEEKKLYEVKAVKDEKEAEGEKAMIFIDTNHKIKNENLKKKFLKYFEFFQSYSLKEKIKSLKETIIKEIEKRYIDRVIKPRIEKRQEQTKSRDEGITR